MNGFVEILDHLDPAGLAYEEWLSVGMALKHEGATAADWEAWSSKDTQRFKARECQRKWQSFNGGNGTAVTGGTIIELAKRQGWTPSADDRPFDWDDVIKNPREDPAPSLPTPPAEWELDPVHELSTYVPALFEPSEYVGFVTEAFERDGRIVPANSGTYNRTAGELLEALKTCDGDIGKVIGSVDRKHGAWIRFNPLDGHGVSDVNVTAWRYTLVESDTMAIEEQAAIYKRLDLPIAMLVHSGKKSLHALVRIDAADPDEYRDRVRFLHEYCEKNGLDIDGANKNPSRLSRMPGVTRGGKPQYIVGTNQGKASWEEWKAFVDAPPAEEGIDPPEAVDLNVWLQKNPPERSWTFNGVVPRGTVTGMTGQGGGGKGQFIQTITMSAAINRTLIEPFEPCGHTKTTWVESEDPPDELHRRFVKVARRYELTKEEKERFAENVTIYAGRAFPLAVSSGGVVTPTPWYRWLAREIQRTGAGLVVIDPLSHYHALDENSNVEMGALLNLLNALTRLIDGGTTVWVNHHTSKQREDIASSAAGRGASAVRDAMRSVFSLVPLTNDEVSQYGITNRHQYVRLDMTKSNYSPRLGAAVYLKRETGENGGVLCNVDMASQRVEVESAMLSHVAKALADQIGDNPEDWTVRDYYKNPKGKEIRDSLKDKHGPTCTNEFIQKAIEHAAETGLLTIETTTDKYHPRHIPRKVSEYRIGGFSEPVRNSEDES